MVYLQSGRKWQCMTRTHFHLSTRDYLYVSVHVDFHRQFSFEQFATYSAWNVPLRMNVFQVVKRNLSRFVPEEC